MKYLGGKQRLGKHISLFLLEICQKSDISLDGYMEPFCGSLGVLKNMTTNDLFPKIIANDYHPDLIQMWKEVRDGLFIYPTNVSEEEYNNAKKLLSPSALKSFIGFGMSFGGRFFGAYAQKYVNDKNEDFCKEMMHSLQRISPKITLVDFTNMDYRDCEPNNMLVYCDPPYKQTKFPIKYRRDVKHYDIFDTDAFWDCVRKWSAHNIVIVSEMTAPEDFIEVWSLERYRSACQSTKTRFQNVHSETYKKEKLFLFKHSRDVALFQ